VWFPRTALNIKYIPKNLLDKNYSGEEWMPYSVRFHTIEGIKINEPYSNSLFHVPAERGTIIWDYRRDLKAPFIIQAHENITDVISWVDLQHPPYMESVPNKRNIYVIVIINIVI
jgi:hypothetical protein